MSKILDYLAHGGDEAARSQAEAEHTLAYLDAALDDSMRLRQGIQDYLDGNYTRAAKNEKCVHGRYGYEGCEQCIDEHFTKLLNN